ncbi:hypothetical protein RCL1_005076 [Eukaryota sp. TZLM3-RCL]
MGKPRSGKKPTEIKFDDASRIKFVSVRERQKAKNQRRKIAEHKAAIKLKEERCLERMMDATPCESSVCQTIPEEPEPEHIPPPIEAPLKPKPVIKSLTKAKPVPQINSLPSLSSAISLDNITPIPIEELDS